MAGLGEITRDKFFDKQQRDKLIKTCREKATLDQLYGRKTWIRRYRLVELALYSGLRVSELADLQVKDLHLDSRQPYLVVKNGKGSKRRDVYLSKKITRHLKKYLKWKSEQGEGVRDDDYLFPGKKNAKSSVFSIMTSITKAFQAAGLPEHYTSHATRHTYAVHLLDKTNNLAFVQQQLGHANIATTSIYLSVLPDKNGTLANMIDDEDEE